MFGLLQPDKEKVGNRLKQIKDEMNLSFTEFGNRLGLKKTTINSYVQGYNLAPIEVVEKAANLSGKTAGWFYFGDIEDYISDYLTLLGHKAMLEDHPAITEQIKTNFFTNSSKNSGCKNEVGYPVEEFIDDCFADIQDKIMHEYVVNTINGYLQKECPSLPSKQLEENGIIISEKIMAYISISREIHYGEKEKIINFVKNELSTPKNSPQMKFDDYYLIGKLINILDDEEQTEDMISGLSLAYTDKHFSTFFGGSELVKIFQSLRPKLIRLYAEKDDEELYEWFEK
ncbi:XRE family transcriptional regulator [Listeria seeligeri]|uniref:helix-turn-helix domain-containing protein n=1 Tax=Listeria seeligeri TaxID=1640 RepID=UPI001941DF25|nr:helix-turn-helix transcriptional regulator [Listeria seeligeri]MBM5604515.1 XRE family transcriptional regulator [Listeria seeligeri]MBM5676194.1 XRE family transcriptional regulator [Listeria seeligeri]